jgi:hypothetical protein
MLSRRSAKESETIPEPSDEAAIFGGPGSSSTNPVSDGGDPPDGAPPPTIEGNASRNWMGIASFVASAIGLGPVGVVLGHLGLREAKRGRATNAGMALAGTVVGYVSIVVLLGALYASGLLNQVLPFGAAAATPTETVTPSTTAATYTLDTSPDTADRWFDLSIGDCVAPFDTITDPADLSIEQPEVTPCDQPHYGEVYAIANIDGEEPPDDATFRLQSREVCAGPLFASYVGVEFSEVTDLYYDVLYPSDRSWTNGTHQLVCLVVEQGETTTGSLRGSAR